MKKRESEPELNWNQNEPELDRTGTARTETEPNQGNPDTGGGLAVERLVCWFFQVFSMFFGKDIGFPQVLAVFPLPINIGLFGVPYCFWNSNNEIGGTIFGAPMCLRFQATQ